MVFEIKLPKHMETALIHVDLHPDYVRMDIKGRTTQLAHPEYIIVEKSKVQRSTTTGILQITMPKEKYTEIQAREMRIQRRLEQKEHEKKLRALEKQQEAAREDAEIRALEEEDKRRMNDEKAPQKKISQALLEVEATQMYGGSVIKEKKETDLEAEARKEAKRKEFYENFKPDFDLDEVPPLE